MMRTDIVPRVPYAVRPVPGIPGEPLQPIDVPLPLVGMAHAWVTLYAHLHALHLVYSRVGMRRPLGKLHDITVGLTPVITRMAGAHAARCALACAIMAVDDIDETTEILAHGHEVGWWVVALQASYALGVWYGLAPDADPSDEAIASDVALRLRRTLRSVFDSRLVDAIQEVAHGDGTGDLLAQVVEGALLLGAPMRGMPKSIEVA